ncbi:hypothetical protein PGT21_018361 [Puccinia graminis f. sp. tritici]|uniref:Secreted protein n=2 Tax=Puccinia graminis f. sp. tritici TaxID=56615 RepID=H6QR38_PUCGT|nr:uncharacterized protein PGTG_21305 [Puccinia graminis f. sp. tritici CRL 75-36-700-3]EHS63013.1 hypothetical protein PGTG_21305 [Puccinia graminis f. sp. tritici CRL 75-36-700-3]KAA1065133.1 hypothetical protein PGTUg99_003237 [Puccinia graminis f. sp. tritici]KAA1119223.1 hypothetical protein PGT21_018361 [Puccinia graminis f. sp. tritici]
MKCTTTALFFALSLSAVTATLHTRCYDYFLAKDGCVFSAGEESQRCAAPKKRPSQPVKAFAMNPEVSKAKRSQIPGLERRYDDTQPSFYVSGGNGTCGHYDTNTQLGVCLWNGAEQDNPTAETAGWLNGDQTANCGKQVYIQRKGHPETVQYVNVLDGCYFEAKTPEPGCFEIGITLALFNKLNPTSQEQQDGYIYDGISWDFNKPNNTATDWSPV